MIVQEKKVNANARSMIHNGINSYDEAISLSTLPTKTAVNTFKGFAEEEQIRLFPFVNRYLQKKIIQKLSKKQATAILNNLNSTARNLFFISLSPIYRTRFLDYLDDAHKKSTQTMLGYPKHSVARIVGTEFATVKPEMTVAEATQSLRKNQKDTDSMNVIYVVDEKGKLLDDLPIRRLILNDPAKKISDLMDGVCLKLRISESADEAIEKFKIYDRTILPVTNEQDLLLGVVEIDDVIDAAENRDTRQMQKFGGIESLEYPYMNTSIWSLIKKRAGWLVLLFLGEMLTATAMGYFEKEIATAVVLALFVPLVISSGGNSGSQAATLIIRAMAIKELKLKDWWYVMRREVFSGLCLGVILGSIGFLRISIWQLLHWYDYGEHWILMAATVFFSLIGIVMWGTLSGSMIPILLKRMKLDPATSSAPFVATLVDVTGLIIYFSIAAIILKGTLL